MSKPIWSAKIRRVVFRSPSIWHVIRSNHACKVVSTFGWSNWQMNGESWFFCYFIERINNSILILCYFAGSIWLLIYSLIKNFFNIQLFFILPFCSSLINLALHSHKDRPKNFEKPRMAKGTETILTLSNSLVKT